MHERIFTYLTENTLMGIIAFGAWGGAVKHLHDVSLNKRKFSFLQLIIHSCISGFFGLLLGLLSLHFQYDIYITLFSTGVGGGLGMKTLDLIVWYIQSNRLVLVPVDKDKAKEKEDGDA